MFLCIGDGIAIASEMTSFDAARLSAIDVDDEDGGQKGEMETEAFQPRGHCLCGASLIKRLSGRTAL